MCPVCYDHPVIHKLSLSINKPCFTWVLFKNPLTHSRHFLLCITQDASPVVTCQQTYLKHWTTIDKAYESAGESIGGLCFIHWF